MSAKDDMATLNKTTSRSIQSLNDDVIVHTSDLANHVLSLTLQEAAEIKLLNRDYGASRFDNIDEDWSSLVSQLRNSIAGSLEISAWMSELSSSEKVLEDIVLQLGDKGVKIQKVAAAASNADGELKPEKLRVALNPGMQDSLMAEMRNYKATLQELIKAYNASKQFQDALLKQRKQCEKFSVAIQRFVRISKTCAEMIPESKNPKVPQSPVASEALSSEDLTIAIKDKLTRRATYSSGQRVKRPVATNQIVISSPAVQKPMEAVPSPPVKITKENELNKRRRASGSALSVDVTSERYSDYSENTTSVKKKRKPKKLEESLEEIPLAKVPPSPFKKAMSTIERTTQPVEVNNDGDYDVNFQSAKRKRRSRLLSQQTSPEFSASTLAALSRVNHRKSNSDEFHFDKAAARQKRISRSVSAIDFELPGNEPKRREEEKRTLRKKKKEKEKTEMSKATKKLSKDWGEEMVITPSKRVGITIETKLNSHATPETVTVSPLWGSSLKAIYSLKEGDDLTSLKDQNEEFKASDAAINPLASRYVDALVVPKEHRPSSSKEITPSTIPELQNVQKLHSGNIIRISENGQEVAVIEIAGKKNLVLHATAEKLIERMVTEEDQDTDFVKCLILTYCQFIPAQTFLEKLISMYYISLGENATPEQASYYGKMQPVIQQKVLNVVLYWVKEQWIDFHQDADLCELLEEFLEEAKQDNHRALLDKVIQAKSHQSSTLTFQLKTEEIEKAKKLNSKPATFPLDSSIFVDLDAKVVAMQLTLENAAAFSAISPSSFYHYLLSTVVKRHQQADLHFAKMPLSHYSIERFLQREQQLTTWVALEICSTSKLKSRRIVIHKFIKIAKICLDNRDFFGALSITNGLYLPPVKRLKKTWEGISSSDQKTLHQIATLMEPQNNMENYRKVLEAAKSPLVPFFPILSRELLIIQEKTEGMAAELVNFAKYRKLYEAIQRFTKYINEPFPFDKVPKITFYIEDRVGHSPKEEDLEKMSRDLVEN